MDFSPTVPFKKLKNTKAWKLTSEYVRKRANGICYTCGQRYPFEKLVAGHFIEKLGAAAIYFDLRGLRAQCGWNCNRQRHGAKEVYTLKLIDEIGRDEIEDLRRLARHPEDMDEE
jgi:hypothetical protein